MHNLKMHLLASIMISLLVLQQTLIEPCAAQIAVMDPAEFHSTFLARCEYWNSRFAIPLNISATAANCTGLWSIFYTAMSNVDSCNFNSTVFSEFAEAAHVQAPENMSM